MLRKTIIKIMIVLCSDSPSSSRPQSLASIPEMPEYRAYVEAIPTPIHVILFSRLVFLIAVVTHRTLIPKTT